MGFVLLFYNGSLHGRPVEWNLIYDLLSRDDQHNQPKCVDMPTLDVSLLPSI